MKATSVLTYALLLAGVACLNAQEATNDEPICHTESSCKVAMETALWNVHISSGYDVRVETPESIQTFTPTDGNPYRMAFDIVKQGLGDGSSVIHVRAWCGAESNRPTGGLFMMKPQQCHTPSTQARADMIRDINKMIAKAEGASHAIAGN